MQARAHTHTHTHTQTHTHTHTHTPRACVHTHMRAHTHKEKEREGMDRTELNWIFYWLGPGAISVEVSTYAQLHDNTLFCMSAVFIVSKTSIQTMYIHTYIHAYTLIHIHLRHQRIENTHALRTVKAFMRYVARRVRRNLRVVANETANLKLKGQLIFFFFPVCTVP